MANIRNKSIEDLSSWSMKDLRKLKITVRNRIAGLESSGKPKPLPDGHPLKDMESSECEELLVKIKRAEKDLANS